jgi:hypothetical protein
LKRESVDTFIQDLKDKKRGMLEEPPHAGELSGFAMAASEPNGGKPELLVNISLHSVNDASRVPR